MKHDRIEADRVVAKSIQLVDDQERTRVRMETHDDSVIVQLCSNDGMPRLELSLVDDEHAAIKINRSDGNQGINLVIRDGESHGIGVCDQEGRPVIQMGVAAESSQERPGFPKGPMVMLIDFETDKTWTAAPRDQNEEKD